MYILMSIVLVLLICTAVLILLWRYGQASMVAADSALKRRALLNSAEQLLYQRLHEILPNYNVMVHVAFDALLTTKLTRTRHKYQHMTADFVVLDAQHQVIVVLGLKLKDTVQSRLQSQLDYQDQLLLLAGYRVIRYAGVPDYQQLRADFHQEIQHNVGSMTSSFSDLSSDKYSLLAKA